MNGRINILLITSDQQHYNTVGVLNKEIKTPNLDRLAYEGTLFTRAYCVNPTCTPTRASIITGKYPSQHGAWSLGTKLPENEISIAQIFSRSGYYTALIGKAHFQPLAGTVEYPSLEAYPVLQDLEFWKDFHGPFYGFEYVELARNHADEPHVGQHYALWMEENGLTNWRRYFRKPTGFSEGQIYRWDLPEKYHYNVWIAEKVNMILERCVSKKQNFFIWTSFFDPHPPYLVPAPWDTMYDPEKVIIPSVKEGEHDKNPPHFKKTQESSPDFSMYQEQDGNHCHGLHSHLKDRKQLAKDIAVYYAMISFMDKYIGIILEKLDTLGLTENTLVVFTSDHGHFYGQHGLIAKGPFHYEDMIRVPLIVRLPRIVKAGRRSEALHSLVDLPVTFLKLCGLSVPRFMTGVDQFDVWTGEKDQVREYVVVENRHQPTKMNCRTYVDRRYKITVYYNQDYGELFDLETDPQEINNLWNEPSIKELKIKLLLKFIHAEMAKEPIVMPRIANA